jgi:hypothetical protein
METIKIDSASGESATAYPTLSDFALSLNTWNPPSFKRVQFPLILPQLVGTLFLLAATTSGVAYTEPVTSLFDGSASLSFAPPSPRRSRITSLNKAWVQAGEVAASAIQRRQRQREQEAREFLASTENE